MFQYYRERGISKGKTKMKEKKVEFMTYTYIVTHILTLFNIYTLYIHIMPIPVYIGIYRYI